VIFWQFANQSVNAAVNYTNRSGKTEIPVSELARNFIGATTLAGSVAMGIKKFAPKSMSRLSPFFAVCAANGLNTSLMRSNEIQNGVPIVAKNGEELGTSKIAAKLGVTQGMISKIIFAS
jgi:hypothetical protein